MVDVVMFVTQMGFNARISDPLLGGTYMTMLNTMSNVGNHWPSSTALWFVDMLTWSRCEYDTVHAAHNGSSTSTCHIQGDEDVSCSTFCLIMFTQY